MKRGGVVAKKLPVGWPSDVTRQDFHSVWKRIGSIEDAIELVSKRLEDVEKQAARIQGCVNAEEMFSKRIERLERRFEDASTPLLYLGRRAVPQAPVLEQRLVDLEGLVAELTDRFTESRSPAGMTKHVHPSERPCAACAPAVSHTVYSPERATMTAPPNGADYWITGRDSEVEIR